MSKVVEKINQENDIHATFSYGIIYIYSISDESHKGRLKIGSATVAASNPALEDIELAANERVKQQTLTADISYTLEHTELAITNDGDYFSDTDVHNVLVRSGYERKSKNVKNTRSEWFEVSLDIAKKAIQATKEKRNALTTVEKTEYRKFNFTFRPNQRDAIDKTTKAIKNKRKHFLWNAKMRFGKTSAAMQVAKENKMKKVLIVTHRPSVSIDWQDDFNKVFANTDYEYSSNSQGENISSLIKDDKSFIYFASLQDLRLSKIVVEDENVQSEAAGFEKNNEVFNTTWDMLIVDEAHEGTQSNLGEGTFSKITTNFSLLLSGTPFNILHKHEEKDIYTWDYVMEQEAKLNWEEYNPGAPNPYAELPSLSIFTYDVDTFVSHLGDLGDNFHDSLDGAFKFHEFFKVQKDEQGNDTAEFVHKSMVRKFLDLLVDNTLATKFPYATGEYRNYNKHSVWLLPNRVKVIEAMEKLLKEHSVFGSNEFGIVNISGNQSDDEEEKDAKNKVTKAIKDHEYTITLTGQRLTTGASIREWTAVLMMSDTSSASSYLQTAFRCQTPARIDGKIKTHGYVFDFAPDRTLKLVAEAIELNHKSGKINTPDQEEAMKQFLNFCPIIAAKSGTMKPYDVRAMLLRLKEAIIDRVSRNGFDDPKLYNDQLLQLDELAIAEFNKLKAIIGKSTNERVNEIEVNNLGMTDLVTERGEEAERKKKQKIDLSEEEKEALKQLSEARKQKKTAISILRAVSIRMPMLVYGANVSKQEDITLAKFIDLVDDESWHEFMPTGLSKKEFSEFIKYYDEDVFKGVTHRIRAKTRDCDNLLPTERIQALAEIFSTFKNPDKETVLTPWAVVNMHMTTAFGGHDFCSGVKDKVGKKPEWKSLEIDTSIWEQDDTKILEINSKSGLYPLLSAYNLYSRQLKKIKNKKREDEISKKLWNKVLAENVYVLCKTPMAKSITLRTLAGYSKAKTNIIHVNDLVEKLQHNNDYKDYNLRRELVEQFSLQDGDMKFTAIVGNPPYQQYSKDTSDSPIYHLFIDEAFKLSNKVSLIHPARFLVHAGKTPKRWNEKMLNDPNLKVLYYAKDSTKVFPNTDIKGGIVITYRDSNQEFGPIGIFTPFSELTKIVQKIRSKSFDPLSELVYAPESYKLNKVFHVDYPKAKNSLSKGHECDITSNIFEKLPQAFLEADPLDKKDYIRILGRYNNEREYRYIRADYISPHSNLKKYKVFLPKSNGTGSLGECLSTPLIGKPFTGHTQTFISIGAFDRELEAENLLLYVKTKFSRVLLGTLKVTQDNKKRTWKNIPLQDFTDTSDIDWSQSIPDIDKQLYEKYDLNEKEIKFIETNVKAMT